MLTNNTIKASNRADEFLSVSDVARMLGVRPRDVSDRFYVRELRDDLCQIVAGRRMIPRSYVSEVAAALRRAGKRVTFPPASAVPAAPGTTPPAAANPLADTATA